MKKLMLFLFVSMVFALNSQSQNDQKARDKQGCFKLASLSISSGVNDYRGMDQGHGDKNFNIGQASNGHNNMHSGNNDFMMGHKNGNITTSRQLNLEIGFNPYSKKLGDYNKERELSFGLYYSGSDLSNRNSTKFTIVPGDTFSHNSAIYQTDTIKRTHHISREEASVLGISAQYLYKTNPDKRFSLFAGYGINIGYALNARIYKRYTRDSSLVLMPYNAQASANDFNNGTLLGSVEQKSSRDARTTFLTSVYIPFGVNFRLSKSKEIWDQMNLFAKADVGMEAETVVNRRPHFLPYMGCSLGFKFDVK
jgi:hypothetical protein